jgi:hypothetical protein
LTRNIKGKACSRAVVGRHHELQFQRAPGKGTLARVMPSDQGRVIGQCFDDQPGRINSNNTAGIHHLAGHHMGGTDHSRHRRTGLGLLAAHRGAALAQGVQLKTGRVNVLLRHRAFQLRITCRLALGNCQLGL